MTTPIDADREMFERLKSIIRSPRAIEKMNDASVNDTLDFCLSRLRRLRMGGRSSALVAMSVLLWAARDRKSDTDCTWSEPAIGRS